MTKEQYFELILGLVGKDNTIEALNLLERFAIEFQLDEILNFVVLNKGRLNRILGVERLGTLQRDAYDLERNRINKAITDTIALLKNEPEPLQTNERVRKGQIAHNIPNRMSKGVSKICQVRIAKIEALLFDGRFKQEDASNPEELEMTETMEVELFDPSGKGAFLIERVTRDSKQIVEDHSPTEWRFRVTPLLEGAHQLELRAFLYKQKGSKELSFETVIEVIAYEENFYANAPLVPWQVTGQAVQLEEDGDAKKPKRGWVSMLFKSAVARATAVIMALVVLSTIGYLIYQHFNQTPTPLVPITMPEKFKMTLRVDTALKVQMVILTPDTINNWTSNQDKSEIYVPEHEAGIYDITVVGSNGYCKKLVRLSKDTNYFDLNCDITKTFEPPKETTQMPPSQLYLVGIVTPFKNPKVKINGNIKTVQTSINSEKMYESVLKLTTGEYRIEVTDAQKLFICHDSLQNLSVESNVNLTFNCEKKKVQTEKFTVTYKIKNVGQTSARNISIYMDGEEVKGEANILVHVGEIGVPSNVTKDYTLKIPNVPKGVHTFQAKISCNFINGKEHRFNIVRDRVITDTTTGWNCVN
jgi:hypothetical protein